MSDAASPPASPVSAPRMSPAVKSKVASGEASMGARALSAPSLRARVAEATRCSVLDSDVFEWLA